MATVSLVPWSCGVTTTVGEAAVSVEFGGTSGQDHPNGGKVDSTGIYRISDTEMIQIARAAERTPDGTAFYSRFFDITINDQGLVAFLATVTDSPGSFSVETGIFIETVGAVRYGPSLGQGSVRTLSFGASASHGERYGETLDPSRRPLNNYGQIVFHSQTGGKNEAIVLFTPDLHWRVSSDGNWDDRLNWTLSLEPHKKFHVVIDPEVAVTIQGPSGISEIRSLRLRSDEGASPTLVLDGPTIELWPACSTCHCLLLHERRNASYL